MGAEHIEFKLWKPVGDELIFTCDVRSEADIYDAVTIWHETMSAYKNNHLDDTQLGVKGGAFIATFPGPDSQSTIPRDPASETSGRDVVVLNQEAIEAPPAHQRYLYDYFGPSIDTGFRVISKCTERYMTLSLEVAYAISLLHFDKGARGESRDVSNLMLLESLGLKGVWGGRTYPLFALDLEADSAIAAAFRQFSPWQYDTAAIHDLCKALYSDVAWPFKLHLPDSTTGLFSQVQPDPLAQYLANASIASEGAETLATEPPGAQQLKEDPPLG